MITTKAHSVSFRAGNAMDFTKELPEGLRCVPIRMGSTAGKFFLNQFPESIFPINSFERHHAVHYGIVIEPENVKEN